MKKHISIIMLLTLILIPSFILVKESRSVEDRKENKIVTVHDNIKER